MAAGSSPLTRGKLNESGDDIATGGIIPAHAGKTLSPASPRTRRRDHPRSRGENKLQEALKNNAAGSSPLTRGKRDLGGARVSGGGIIPAHAGKTSAWTGRTSQPRDHPRSRGENSLVVWRDADVAGSSPLTRGKHWKIKRRELARGIIPAHAGKTIHPCRCYYARGDHPRSRGENDKIQVGDTRVTGSSPLTRGKHQGRRRFRNRLGIIPAHAGKTYPHGGLLLPQGDHPRSRGENSDSAVITALTTGSSPLTRGKPT